MLRTVRLRLLLLAAIIGALTALAHGQENLARKAHATASEFQPGLPAELGNDGNANTRWSGIPGHNRDVWYELDWDQPVTVGEILVRQFQRFSFEWDVQVWDDAMAKWRTVQHFGKDGVRLPGLVLCTVEPPVSTTKVRIANITNGPSFTEVEVFASSHAHPPVINMASDLRGNFVGMICDGVGAMPVAGKGVRIQCATGKGGITEYAVSDESGLFYAPIPVDIQAEGIVKVMADGIAPSTWRGGDFQRAVTPIDYNQKPVALDDGWKFKIDPTGAFNQPSFDDRGWSPIKVPAHWEMEGFRSKSGIGGYRKHFRTPSGSGRLMLRFDGVYSVAQVSLNGHIIAHHQGGFTPFEMDVTDLVQPGGDNVLALLVKEHSNVSDNLDKMSQYADFPLAGIMRKVTLFRVPTVHVEALEQSTRFNNKQSADIAGRVSVINRSDKSAAITTEVSLDDSGGHEVSHTVLAEGPVDSLARGEALFSMSVPNPHPWSAEHPYLYTLRIELKQRGRTLQSLRQHIGLRQTTIDGTRILINGSPVKFRGTCHHDQYPTMGRAVTPEVEKLDVQLIKKANLNALRTSHYPPMPELIQDADEMGLYVEDEADFCWVGVADDLRNAPIIMQLTAELLARDRNHPSVFMWSLCNESDFGFDFERSHDWVRKVDPSRPTGAATSAWTEIATLHNPIAIKRIQENEGIDKPLLFDESWCIYQGIFGDVAEMWIDPGMRDYYAEPLPGIWDVFMKSHTTQGSMIWAWSDDLFVVPHRSLEYGRSTTQSHFVEGAYQMPGRGIVGDAPWGVVDGWRREKPEFWITKKLQSPVKMTEVPYVPGQPTRFEVKNEYDFTNLSDLWISYKVGGVTSPLHLNIGPRSSANVLIPASNAPGPLVVTATNTAGELVDQFTFVEKPKPVSHPDGPALDVHDEGILAGDSTHIVGKDFELAFEKDGGFLRECVYQSQPFLVGFPELHILPTNAPMRELPDRLGWHLDEMSVDHAGKNVKVTLKGRYPNLVGAYEYTITPGGEITVHSKFTYAGANMLAREIGLRFSVPRTCDTLSWSRIAEWGAYPEDHIGRPVGNTQAFASHPHAVPPTWAWSQDNTPLGSNDFRSTKRHILAGAISYPTGQSLAIDSDGTQSLRAIAEPDRLTLHVSDWYGGTNVGWGEWITNYGRGKEIKSGDVLESTVHLRFQNRTPEKEPPAPEEKKPKRHRRHKKKG
jgi:beta-galactosidase